MASFCVIAAFSFPLASCSNKNSEASKPALFETKAEAIKAAKGFGCTGAHKMGDKWMPCEQHGVHGHKENSHSHHNH